MKKYLIASVLFLGVNMVQGQAKLLKDLDEAQKLSKTTMEKIKAGKVGVAIDELGPYWPIPPNEVDEVREKTVEAMELVEGRYGFLIGAERVREEKISDFAYREVYLLRYRNSALRFMFTYYKNKEGWLLNGFKWDELFEEEFRP